MAIVAAARRAARGILLLGSYQHLPNVDALDYLCAEILPRVDEHACFGRHPLQVVGNGLTESVSPDGVAIAPCITQRVGWVPSVAAVFSSIEEISIVPLQATAPGPNRSDDPRADERHADGLLQHRC